LDGVDNAGRTSRRLDSCCVEWNQCHFRVLRAIPQQIVGDCAIRGYKSGINDDSDIKQVLNEIRDLHRESLSLERDAIGQEKVPGTK
jgi:hypothetical protein